MWIHESESNGQVKWLHYSERYNSSDDRSKEFSEYTWALSVSTDRRFLGAARSLLVCQNTKTFQASIEVLRDNPTGWSSAMVL